MNIKPIRTDKDYEEALQRVELLMDAKEGTVEFDELEILSTLIENYEANIAKKYIQTKNFVSLFS